MKRLTIGILGLGGAGRAHARRFQRNAHVKGIVAFDTKPRPWRNVEVLDDLGVFLDRVDAVSICTLVDSIIRGVPVLVPYADGRRVIELCETLEHDAGDHAHLTSGVEGWSSPAALAA